MVQNAILRYNSARLFAESRTAPETINPVSLITDFEFGFNLSRETVKSVGYGEILRPIVSNQRPFFSFSYLLSDMDNEKLFRMPVTSDQAFEENTPIFTGLEPMDFFFLTSDDGSDMPQNNDGLYSKSYDLSAVAFSQAFLKSYSMEILGSGLIKIRTSWEAENVSFKNFLDISDDGYKFVDYDVEDLEVTDQQIFQLNDGTEELNLGVGGFALQGRIQNFNFSAQIPTKTLYDFGQYSHKTDIKYPIESRISIDAFVSQQISGDLKSMLCSDKGVDFLFSNFRGESCEDDLVRDDKSGMLFNGAKLLSQKYSMSSQKGNYLTANLDFSLDITKKSGVFFSQHKSKDGALIAPEDTTIVSRIILESEDGGGILEEVAIDMIRNLRKLRDKV